MFRLPRIAPVALSVLTFVSPSVAQTSQKEANAPAKVATPANAAPAKSAESKSAALTEEERKQRARRVQARSLLIALSTDARNFSDQTLRARSLARIADALWTVDAEQGRLLFRKAWEAAEGADQEADRKLQEEINQQKSKTGGGFAVALPANIRREVLRLAARHDRTLGEEFLEKLRIQKLEAATAATQQKPNRVNDAANQRLAVARVLLQEGEMERALQFADPVLTTVTMEGMSFLSFLREKNAAAADERYASLLSASANNPQSDANTVSLLSSYIFTPQMYVTFSADGTNSSQMSSRITPAEVSAELRNAFFQSAAAILLRPLAPPGQDQTSSGVEGRYMVIKRLLPLFEQSAPADMVESLRAQLNALNAVVPEATRSSENEWLTRGLRPENPQPTRSNLSSIESTVQRPRLNATRCTFSSPSERRAAAT